MTPDPTIVDDLDGADVERGESQPWTDKASDVAFGGQSSADAAEMSSDNGSLPMLVAFVAAILAIGFVRSWWFPGILGGLLVVLFLHEFAHFITARASGMKVTEFFIGFGPKIWSFNRGETEYGVKAIPAGAYVRIMGMTNLDEIDPAEEHRTYRAQPYWQRMMTICAGSAMHFLIATIALVVMFASYGYPGFNGPPWVVDVVVPGSTASTLGIEPGDRIVSINGDGFANWDEFGEVVSSLDEGPVEIVIDRDGDEQSLNGELGLRPKDVLYDGFGLLLLDEGSPDGFEAAFVWPEDQADQFGIEPGDVLLSAGGVNQPDINTMAAMLRARDGDEIEIQVLRDDETLTLDDMVALNTTTPFRGFFGVGPIFVPEPEPGFVTSAGLAIQDFGVIAKTNIVGLAGLANPTGWFSDDTEVERRAAELQRQEQLEREQAAREQAASESGESTEEVSDCGGPDTNRPLSMVGIGRLISCSESVEQVLFMFAVVNIFIGIFNLLPVLPVDGGHAALATYERVRSLITRKPHRVDAAKLVPMTWVVILLLVGLGLWTTVLDIFSW